MKPEALLAPFTKRDETHRIDEIEIDHQYVALMRRAFLTLLTAFALAASGMANAMTAQTCPMQAMVTAAAHDCCPENEQPADQGHDQHDMDGCLMGMACRTAPAVAPTLAPIRLPAPVIQLSQPITSEPAKPSGPLQQLFRPPRTI